MNHMPYEEMEVGSGHPGPNREAPPREEPGRTPHSAEGPERERELPAGEPGKTPGSAEGEEPDRRPEPPLY